MADKKKFYKPKDNTHKPDIILYMKVGGKDRVGVNTNIQPWTKWWRDVAILGHDSSFHHRLVNMDDNLPEPTLDEELEPFEDVVELPVDRLFFEPTEEQIDELDALGAVARRARRTQMENQWIIQRTMDNAQAKMRNEINKTHRAIIIKKFTGREERKSELWGAIVATIEKDSLDKIKAYVRGVPGDEDYMTYDMALVTWDWLFLFKAAEHTHLMLDDTMDPYARDMRKRQELSKLENYKQGNMKFEKWINNLEEQTRLVEMCGQDVTERDKINVFMSNLNPTIFKQQLEQWSVPSQRSMLPENYNEVKSLIQKDYEYICVHNPSLIQRVYNTGNNNWKSFKTNTVQSSEDSKEESKETSKEDYKRTENGQKACFICGAYGSSFHFANKCEHFNDKFSLIANRKYYEEKGKNKKNKK